jgi:uncharacterized protein YukE
MAMGSTGTVNITPEMMKNALNVIEEYRTQSTALYDQLSNEVANLVPGNFSGSAADGFKTFYTEKIEPAVGTGLTQLLDALRDICQGTLDAIPNTDGLDDQLGEGNKK